MVKSFKLGVSVAVIAIGLNTSGQAFAQASGQPEAVEGADEKTGGLVDIVVTAQRREQNLQSVPGSVAAVSGDTLEKSQVTDIRQLLVTTPNISYTQFRANEPTLYVRGIGPFLNTVGLERPTGFYVDDVYVGGSGVAALGTLFGIERVEVLRGPQGTLFGRNVTAGVIQYVTKDPSQTSDGKVALSYGNYDYMQGQLYANGGLGSGVSANIAASWTKRDGFARNLTSGDELENEDAKAIRAKLAFDLGPDTELILSADYFDRDVNGTSRISVRNNGFGAPSSTRRSGTQPDGANAYGPGAIELESWGGSVRLKSDLGFANLSAIAAYREYSARDFSVAQVRNDGSIAFGIPANGVRVTTDNAVEQDQKTIELRLDNTSDTFDYVAGLFYLEENVDGRTIFRRTNNFGASLAAATLGIAPLKATSYAAFVDGIFHITPELSVGGGLRYTRDRKSVAYSPRNLITNTVLFTRNDKYSNGEFTYRALVQYEPNDDINLYANYSRGYKAGGFDTEATALSGTFALDPETVDAYEIGFKSDFLDNRIRLNMAAFTMKLKGYQISALDPVTLTTRSFNAGNLRSKGFEIEAAAIITDGLQLNLGYGYTKANYTSDIVSAGININGFKVQRVPANSFNAGISYEIETDAGTFDTRADFSYVDKMEGNERNQPQNQHPSFTTLNGSISWTSTDEHWTIRLWGRNLTNELITRQVTSLSTTHVGAVYDAPRTYGVTVSRNF